MAKIMHRYECRAKAESKKWFQKSLFQVAEQFSFQKNYVECKKT